MKIYPYLIIFLLIGCATVPISKFNTIKVGMTEKEVIEILGPPNAIMATEKARYLYYDVFVPDYSYGPFGYNDRFVVKLVDEKVKIMGHKSFVRRMEEREDKLEADIDLKIEDKRQ